MARVEGALHQKFQGTCKRPTTIVDLEHCVQKDDESAHHWARRVAEIVHSSDSITAQTAVLVLGGKLSFSALGPETWAYEEESQGDERAHGCSG